MRLKKTFVGIAGALALTLTAATPMAMAQQMEANDSAEADATVTITENGMFAVTLTDVDFGEIERDVYQVGGDVDLAGSTTVTYTDTYTDRVDFTTSLVASDFTGADDSANTILAENLTITRVNAIEPDFCTADYADDAGQACEESDWAPTGDISALDENGDPAPAGADWVANNTLNEPRDIHQALAGSGTGSETTGVVDLNLLVPDTTEADDYTSTMTVTVVGSTP